MKTRSFTRAPVAVAVIAVAALALTACTADASADPVSTSSATDASTLTVSRGVDPTSFDPASSISTGQGLEALVGFYERLIDADASGELVPALATEWAASDDGLTYTLTLREGVTYHDGSPFTAEEVRYNWQRIVGTEGAALQYWGNVADVEAVDDLTVAFHLTTVDPTFLGTLAGQRGIYMGPNKACVEANETTPGDWAVDYFTDHECGTGPYTLESWDHNEAITMTAYDDYWGGWDEGQPTTVVQKIIAEPSTVQLLLASGEVDIAGDAMPIQILEQLREEEGVTVDVADTTTLDQIVFNMESGPTADPKVREALALAFDYDSAIQQAYAGYAEPAVAAVPSTVWPEISADQVPVKRDVEKAKELLAEAGYPDGFEIDFAMAENNQWSNLALILESSLSEVGVKVNTVSSTWPVLFEKLGTAKDYGMAGYQMWAAIPDPNDILLWWDTDAISLINPGWGDAETDALIHGAVATDDEQERIDLYTQVISDMNADMPAIWVDQPKAQTAMRDYVEGFTYNPYYNGLIDFYSLSKS